ncbi:hypothetical protein AALB16_04350 [Lachnospiraceae bacterium 62-35]
MKRIILWGIGMVVFTAALMGYSKGFPDIWTKVDEELVEELEDPEKEYKSDKEQQERERTLIIEEESTTASLISPPELYLSDALSSLYSEFKIYPGSYQWNYLNGEEEAEVIACGIHPLKASISEKDILTVPDYNGIDKVSYAVACQKEPDFLIVKEWDMSQIGSEEYEEYSKVVYDIPYIELQQNKVYEITAVWEERGMEERGFFGNADYLVVTGQ